MQVQLQQGDVNIIKIDKTEFVVDYLKRPVESNVVREGTATGHSHRIVGTEFKLFRTSWPSRMFAHVISDDCKMIHEEHEDIKLEPGLYEFVVVTEYDHFAEMSRRVWD